MSHLRFTGAEACPLDDLPVTMTKCGECRFFRGAASSRQEPPDGERFKFPHGWEVHCNWPRDGAYVALPGDGYEHPGVERAVGGGAVPDVFKNAWSDE